MTEEEEIPECVHGTWLMKDSCPGCDYESETPHTADPVKVRGFLGRTVTRCRACGLMPIHRIHKSA